MRSSEVIFLTYGNDSLRTSSTGRSVAAIRKEYVSTLRVALNPPRPSIFLRKTILAYTILLAIRRGMLGQAGSFRLHVSSVVLILQVGEDVSLAEEQRKIQSTIMPEDLMKLDKLEAYLKLPGNLPITKVKFDYHANKTIAPSFVEKKIKKLPLPAKQSKNSFKKSTTLKIRID